jgi:hypothetical protein
LGFKTTSKLGKRDYRNAICILSKRKLVFVAGKLGNFLHGAKQLTTTSSLTLRTARTWAKDIDPYVKEPYLRHSTANSEGTTTYFTINTLHFGR